MMKQYQMDGVNQSAARYAAAQVTRAKPTVLRLWRDKQDNSPNLRRECAELGVCQGLEPPCGLCAQHTEPDTSAHYSIEPIAYWGAVVALSIFSAATLAGVLGYLFA